MCMLTQMFYDAGVFRRPGVLHFDTFYTWGTAKIARGLQSIVLKLRFARALRRERIDAVFVMTSSNWGFYDKCLYCLIARALGVKTVLNPVGGHFKEFHERHPIHRWLVPWMLRIPDAVIAGTSYWFDYFRRSFRIKRLIDIPNPVLIKDRNVIRKGEGTGLTVLFLARLEEGKGIRELLEAIEELAGRSAGLRFIIAGDGPLMGEVRMRLEPLCADGHVTIRGHVGESEKSELFRQADVYVLPTYSEVLPVSMLEAMSYRVAVIATNVGGIPDAVEHGVSGFLIEPRNVQQLVKCISRFEADRRKLVQMAESGFERCCRLYDLDVVVARHFDVFRALTH